MKIRAAVPTDIETIHELRKKLWEHLDSDDINWLRNQFQNHSDKFQIFLAETEKGYLIGFAEAGIRTDYVEGCETNFVGYIEGWFVEENYRRQNVGRKLIEKAENWAREKGCREMASDCEIENELSLNAHLGIDYEEVSRNIHFRKEL